MTKKTQSTSEKFIKSLSPQELKEFNEGYKNFALSELILAIMEQDEISVRKLAKIADVSPTIIQEMRSGLKKNYSMESFYKILKTLGFDQFMVGHNGQFIPIDLSYLNKK
jgi:DNA-directed RNA polymerase subunit F